MKREFLGLKHDINSTTSSVKIVLEMILEGTLKMSDEEILRDAIAKLDKLSRKQKECFGKVTS